MVPRSTYAEQVEHLLPNAPQRERQVFVISRGLAHGVRLILPIVVSLILATACGSPAPTPPPPRELVNQAAQTLLTTQAFHFIIEFTGDPTYLDKDRTLALRRVEGDIVRPDRMRATVKASLPGAYVQIQAIGIGNDQYATNPLNNQWEKIPPEWGFDPSLLFQADGGLGKLLLQIRDLSSLANENIENQPHFHVAGKVDSSQITPLTGWIIGEGSVNFDLWVGAQDHYVRRIRFKGNPGTVSSSSATPPTQWDIQLSNFNQPVTITAPQ